MILALAAAVHLLYHYRTGAVMSGRANFGPANAAFDKANAGGNSALTVSSYDANTREGTIAVDLVQRGAGGSAVFNVSEDGRKAYPCAVDSAAGEAICDVDAHFGNPTLVLLKVIGPDFYDPARVDAHGKWTVNSSGGTVSETSEFTVQKRANGLSTIAIKRTSVQQAPDAAIAVEGTINYDDRRQVPTALHCAMTVTPQGPGAPPAVTTAIDLDLAGG